ncbi:MAG TPA: SDR family NAD(P)-dependent oxidoreductase, partial [Steroidobacteraceae bacterium]|nr:SDR family NAD(P)-dependent oxidoreductase [Steroidobacteraceae bacterium]
MTAQNPASNPFSLHGKVALVTGASTGLGQGIAIALAQAGADVVGVARTSTADAQRGVTAAGRKFYGLHSDLEQRNAAANVVAQAIKLAGRVDILVNNAGII